MTERFSEEELERLKKAEAERFNRLSEEDKESIRQFNEAHERFLESMNAYCAYRRLKAAPPLGSVEARLRFAEAFYEWHESVALLSGMDASKEEPEADISEAEYDMARARYETAMAKFRGVIKKLEDGAYQTETPTALKACAATGRWLAEECRRISETDDFGYAAFSIEVLAKASFIKPIPEQYAFDGGHVEPTIGATAEDEAYVLTGLGFALTLLAGVEVE